MTELILEFENPNNSVHLKLNNFEGPFDLLYHLIEKNEMDIYDIDINEITDQYLNWLSNAEQLDLDIASEFTVMAATLLYIKSRMLLPNKKTENDEEDAGDPREELVVRLLEYKKYKTAATVLKNREEKWANCIYKVPEAVEYKKEYDNRPMSLTELKEVYEKIKEKNRQKTNKNKKIIATLVQHEIYTVKSKLKEISELFKKRNEFIFNRIFDLKKRHRLDVISGFLAVLELAKFHKVSLKQLNLNDDIYVKKLSEIKLSEMNDLIKTAVEE